MLHAVADLSGLKWFDQHSVRFKTPQKKDDLKSAMKQPGLRSA